MTFSDLILFACDSCGTKITFPAEASGQIEICPHCFEYVDVPSRIKRKPQLTRIESVAPPAAHALTFQVIDDLPRPGWDDFSDHVFSEMPESQWHSAFCEAARYWLANLRAALTGPYSISESANFLLLSALPERDAAALLDFCEQCLARILSDLAETASDAGYGKHVLLAFADAETYYTYVSHFHGDGEYGSSAGMFLPGAYDHIAVHAVRFSLHRTIAHELTHACLAHLFLPSWLNEGLTQEMEDLLLNQPSFDPTVELTRRQKHYWREHGLELFWSGQAFQAIDEGQELAYALSRVLVRIVSVDFADRFAEFANTAHFSDAGQAAAVSAFGLTLGQLAAKFLGSGDWDPRESYGDDDAILRSS